MRPVFESDQTRSEREARAMVDALMCEGWERVARHVYQQAERQNVPVLKRAVFQSHALREHIYFTPRWYALLHIVGLGVSDHDRGHPPVPGLIDPRFFGVKLALDQVAALDAAWRLSGGVEAVAQLTWEIVACRP